LLEAKEHKLNVPERPI